MCQTHRKKTELVTKKSNKKLIVRPGRKSSSHAKSSLGQRSIAATSAVNTNQALINALQRGIQFEQISQYNEAEQVYRELTDKYPQFAPAWHALGMLAFNFNQFELAVKLIARAASLDTETLLYHRNLGEMSRRLGMLDQAVLSGKHACSLAPDDLDAHYNLGLAYTDLKDYGNAIRAYRKALKINPEHGLSWNNLGSALEQQGDQEGGLHAYLKAVDISPTHAEPQNNIGAIYSERGKVDEARRYFGLAIAARPDFIDAHYNVSTLKSYSIDDPHVAMLENVLPREQGLSRYERIRYHFAMGKAFDDTGRYDQAFQSYEIANRLQHEILPVDERRADALFESILRVFDRSFFEQRKDWKGSLHSPIFIVGMPRSGTSLLEQILSTLPSVYGAGELTDLHKIVSGSTQAGENRLFTESVSHLTEAQMRRIGDDYCRQVWNLSPQSQFITDKMPANFFYLGLIHLALPNARIIHTMRDPMDSCFSCFSRMFNDTMEFAYDQQSLGRYYARYIKIMRHWHEVLPAGRILDLQYEALVSDTEFQARRILEFVGLPWNPECLAFYKNERVVKTASVVQVRRPIYQTSVARWKHFASHLQPLYELVNPYRPLELAQEDIVFKPNPPVVLHDPQALVQQERVLIDRAIALQGQQDHVGVLTYLDAQTSLVEQSPLLLHLKGISYYRLDRFDEGLLAYEQALRLQPQFPAALNSMGFLLQDIGRMQEAKAAFAQSVMLSPEFSMGRLNLGLAQLKLGEWEQGWENYEARWTGSAETASPTFKRPEVPLPQWDGQTGTEGQSLLVITEQGFGDTFQFSRLLSQAAKRFALVGFVCSQPTQRLMEWAYGNHVMVLVQMPTDYEVWNWHCPLMSLPRALKLRVDSIPPAQPFFPVMHAARQFWAARLNEAAPGRFRVGIAWSGRNSHQYDGRRSIAFGRLAAILDHPSVTWVSLQKWTPEQGLAAIPNGVDWLDWTAELIDFGDTAGLIANLDLVITIDSSMVHLAGAMGRPVWMMNRFDSEWRWLGSRQDSPWYPTLKIFNQPNFGDWGSVLQDVRTALHTLPIVHHPAKQRATVVQTPAQVPTYTPNQDPSAQATGRTIEQAMQLAGQLQSAGRAGEAQSVLKQILEAQPQHAHALHLLGVVTYQLGQAKQGLALISQAIQIDQSVALFYSNAAEMLRQQGEVQQAVAHGLRAIAIDPTMASAYSNLGVAYYDLKDYAAAERSHQQALSLNPSLLQSLNNLGSIERARKNRLAAIDWYQKALSVNPAYLESLSNLGAVLVESERAEEAEPLLERGLALAPDSAEILCNLGLAYFKIEKFAQAQQVLSRSLALKPGYPEAMTGMACVLNEADRAEEARALLLEVIARAPEKLDALCQLAGVYTELGQAALAQETFIKALEIDPESTDALAGLGNLSLEAGDLDEAETLLKKAISIDSDNIDARFHLTQIKRVMPWDDNLNALEQIQSKATKLNSNRRLSLHYALGKAYDDLKDYDKAFQHFHQGAQLKRSKLKFDIQAEDAFVQSIIQTIDQDFLSRFRGAGSKSSLPIFVLGMPRSGTTLTEQIIASHPDVFGAGELPDLAQIIQRQTPESRGIAFPQSLLNVSKHQLTQWGDEYAGRLQLHAQGVSRITDKMPSNYMLMGLIPLMLPQAKIIHVKRNPIDTCLSCFMRLFNRHQDATYDLSELGRHYVNYVSLMEHWKRILPPGSFIEVEYERLIDDIESEAKRLIAYCDLPWDEACLAFYKNDRQVRTASVAQVRQPIYKTSVERWRHYEKYLGPLLNELDAIQAIDSTIWSNDPPSNKRE